MRDRSIPKVGDVYKHFKGNLYEIVGVATHTETMEEMVVYKPYNVPKQNTTMWVRPLSMFMSEVDHDKYPDVEQKYRLEYVTTIPIA